MSVNVRAPAGRVARMPEGDTVAPNTVVRWMLTAVLWLLVKVQVRVAVLVPMLIARFSGAFRP